MWKLVLLFAVSLPLHALELKKGQTSIHIKDLPDWTLGKELFGIPFIYFSPQINGQRSNISFTDMESEVTLKESDLKGTEGQYITIKKTWAASVKAKPINFSTLQSFANKNGHIVYNIEFEYEFQGKHYFEKSYYVNCKGRLIFSKSLRLKENGSHENSFKDLIDSLSCGSV